MSMFYSLICPPFSYRTSLLNLQKSNSCAGNNLPASHQELKSFSLDSLFALPPLSLNACSRINLNPRGARRFYFLARR